MSWNFEVPELVVALRLARRLGYSTGQPEVVGLSSESDFGTMIDPSASRLLEGDHEIEGVSLEPRPPLSSSRASWPPLLTELMVRVTDWLDTTETTASWWSQTL